MKIDGRLVQNRREDAQDALMDYAEALRAWNAPDDEHTRLSLRQLVESVIAEVFIDGL